MRAQRDIPDQSICHGLPTCLWLPTQDGWREERLTHDACVPRSGENADPPDPGATGARVPANAVIAGDGIRPAAGCGGGRTGLTHGGPTGSLRRLRYAKSHVPPVPD